MVQDNSQEEIAQKLGMSQPTVSRDMQRLDKEAAGLSSLVEKSQFRFNIVWQLFEEIDTTVKHAFDHYQKIEGSDHKGRYEALRLLTGLLGRKCYLILYMRAYTSLYLNDYRDGLKGQFLSLKKTIEEFGKQLGVEAPSTTQAAQETAPS